MPSVHGYSTLKAPPTAPEQKHVWGARMKDARAQARARQQQAEPSLAKQIGGRDVSGEVVEHIPAGAVHVAPGHQRALWERESVSGLIERFDPETGALIARGHFVRWRAMHAFAPVPAGRRGVVFSREPRPIWITDWVDGPPPATPTAASAPPWGAQ